MQNNNKRSALFAVAAPLTAIFSAFVGISLHSNLNSQKSEKKEFVHPGTILTPEATIAQPITPALLYSQAYIYDADLDQNIPAYLYKEDTERPRRVVDHEKPDSVKLEEKSADVAPISVIVPPPSDPAP